jgi:hypothetical protein
MDMFDPSGYYLFRENKLPEAFAPGLRILKLSSFPAPKDTNQGLLHLGGSPALA